MRLRFDLRGTARDRPDATAPAGVRTAPLSELDKIRYTLVPQLRVYDAMQQGAWLPLVMRGGHANFRSSVVNTDRFGARHTATSSGATSLERPPDEDFGLLAGGSTAFGVGSTSDATTLAACLTERTRQPWVNVGVRAWTLNQSLAFCFMHADLLQRTTRIVLFAGLNELAVVLQSRRVPRRYGSFYGWRTLDEALNKDLPADAVDAVVVNGPSAEEARTRALLAASTASVLAGWRVLAKGLGASVCLALQPFASWSARAPSVEEQTLFGMLDAMEANSYGGIRGRIEAAYHWWAPALAALCRQQSIPFVDCNQRFSAPDLAGQWCFVDRAHLTDRGNRLSAIVIDTLLEEAGRCQSSPSAWSHCWS